MQVNCSDGHRAALEKVTFEVMPTISRENARCDCLSVVPKNERPFCETGGAETGKADRTLLKIMGFKVNGKETCVATFADS